MSQYINLLGPAFRKQRQVLTLTRALMMTGLAALVMLALQAYDQQQIKGMREELASAQALAKAQQVHTDRIKGEGAAKKGTTVLDLEVQGFEKDLRAVRDNLMVLEGGGLGNRTGFSSYLQAFSRQAIDGLWLTGFTVAGSGNVAINGRVIRPELVPAYIQKLNNEPVLQGRAFASLEMRRPAPLANAAPAKDGVKDAVELPRYLEFVLTSGDMSDAAKTTDAQGAGK